MSTIGAKSSLSFALAPSRPLVVGLLGCGVVGSAIVRRLLADQDRSEEAFGYPIQIKNVAVLHAEKHRDVPLNRSQFTTDPYRIVNDPDVDVVIEAIGGIDPPLALLRQALLQGKDVITANKDLIAHRGHELRRLADRQGVHLRYEAAVGGGIPVLKAVRESLRGTSIKGFSAILNGTCNFVLTAMETHGLSLEQALGEAVALGYAEADATADTDGWDTVFKLAILVHDAFSLDVDPSAIFREGITKVSLEDLRGAQSVRRRIRLVATASWDGTTLRAAVQPFALPESQVLADLPGCENGVIIETGDAGELFFRGPGAGGEATATSVLGDLGSIAILPPRIECRAVRQPPAIKASGVGRFLVRIVSGEDDAESRIGGAFFGHGLAIDELEHVPPYGTIVVTEACEPEVVDFVSECLYSRGATEVSIFPTV